ncbi:hypothetical protein Tco_1122901 [Tanacetum coccineum]|uniref:Uncharacterized protein n=1 Tax=Tanacetum coccineum TaxID=301880 RepID=A0ABQ5J2Y5_9ASTR
MMSSPNHPTSEIEDAFSSNFLDFIMASPDYVPASSRKTYSVSSNSFGVVPITSPTLSLFHDDPFMKVMHAYYAKESPIPPPTIVPSSSMFNPQEFFLPEELLSPKKQGHNQSFSSTSTLHREFEMGESSPELQKAHARNNINFKQEMRGITTDLFGSLRITDLEQNASQKDVNILTAPPNGHGLRGCHQEPNCDSVPTLALEDNCINGTCVGPSIPTEHRFLLELLCSKRGNYKESS